MLKKSSMFCCAPYAGTSFAGIRAGRANLAEQFGSMDGWQHKDNARFDAFVQDKRQQEKFEGFDQRVERAYRSAVTMHKSEVVNGFKRKLKASGGRFSADVMREMNSAIEERSEWLRDVFTQIDGDYRSSDVARQEKAAAEISAALNNEPSDYMAVVYDKKREVRFLGEKGKSAHEVEAEDANFPTVTDDEANRYHGLKMNMLELERNVKAKFGAAGGRHWAVLQQSKDTEYESKLVFAEEKFRELLSQDALYQEMLATSHNRNEATRQHRAQLRFKGAIELEKAREKLIESHKMMEKERADDAKAYAREKLAEISKMKQGGKTSQEILMALKLEKLEQEIQRQDGYKQSERSEIDSKRATFLDIIGKMQSSFEQRDGEALLNKPAKETKSPLPVTTIDDGRFSEAELTMINEADSIASQLKHKNAVSSTDRDVMLRKQSLWNVINADKFEDPFRTVHQARIDAAVSQDPIFTRTMPTQYALGPDKYKTDGNKESRAGRERFILKTPNQYTHEMDWSLRTGFKIDGDGSTGYGQTTDGMLHIRDQKTWDIDYRYEKRSGGPVFKGPRFYKIGSEREKKEPGERTFYATSKKGLHNIKGNPQRSE